NLVRKEKIELTKSAISNYEVKKEMSDNYSTFGLTTPALVLGRLIDTGNFQEFNAKKQGIIKC
ncbi:MAG: hypothetical protein GY756_15850, partial [bacterium]|nr:hypothetical protein [bacterium]